MFTSHIMFKKKFAQLLLFMIDNFTNKRCINGATHLMLR